MLKSYNFVPFNFMSAFPSQVRKAAQQGICSVLRGSEFLFTDNAPTHHPAAVTTAKFCMKEMEQAGGKTTVFFFLSYCGKVKSFYGCPASCRSCLFLSPPQAAKRTPPHFMCWVFWRSWWGRFLWELSNPVVKLCCEWWHSAIWWEHRDIHRCSQIPFCSST